MRRPMDRQMGIGRGAWLGEGRELELRSTDGVGGDVWSGARMRGESPAWEGRLPEGTTPRGRCGSLAALAPNGDLTP